MDTMEIFPDPYNIILTGVGGQGNVLASRLLGNLLVGRGYCLTLGETFGASQRGGSVMSHLRVSRKTTWSPQIPSGKADLIAALEPVETLRVLAQYGNPKVKVLVNTRPVYPLGVIAGELTYPSLEEIQSSVRELSAEAWFINATDLAVKLGNAVLGNIIMVGAICGVIPIPINREDFKEAVLMTLPPDKLDINLKAFDLGMEMLKR